MPNIENRHPEKEITQTNLIYMYRYIYVFVQTDTQPAIRPCSEDGRRPYSIFFLCKKLWDSDFKLTEVN
jgi:hypothetical protein